MRDLEDEARIKAYMEAKMKHIKMYNECMNLADGLDVEKFAELVRADEREACAKVCDEMWSETGRDAWANDCAKAIRARNDVHAIDISEKRVDETAKDRHGACVTCGALIEDQIIQPPFTLQFDAKGKPQREWVGLTDEEAWKCWDWEDFQGTWKSMESKLKDKNT